MTHTTAHLSITPGSELEWIQPSMWRRRFELQLNGEKVGTLEFPSFFSTTAKAEFGRGCWVFKQSRFWNPTMEIRECDKELPMAKYESKVLGNSGTLRLSLGRSLIFRINMWATKAEFETERGEILFSMAVRGVFRYRANMVVHHTSNSYAEAPWILCLMWYLVLHEKRRRRAS